ncbi:MAG TPA: vitamin B12 dependent-methionine synthase activation domain-containing protein [Candidatus Kapabacteria bacterium]|nr:vitamin B12 dependent-methionine synthase activation domain-containing protein [Candidatus Kapabacteria bacterium]
MHQEREVICTYDPLKEFLAHYADAKSAKSETVSYAGMSVEEKLKQRIIDGDKLGLDDDLREALTKYSALEIVNDILLGGMKVVGDLFGAGEMQLPFVLQSAETMKAAVKFLEPFMEKVEGEQSKGVMVLATVKGDVHDIGKNLVDIILTNNGYRVVNLGIKVALEPMLDAVTREHADALGMSGLLVKSTAIMKENLEVMESRNLRIPVVLGGAALTRKFVEKDLRALYNGTLSYAQDAFDGLHFMQKLKNPDAALTEAAPSIVSTPSTNGAEDLEEELDNATGAESKIVMASRALPWLQHPKQTTSGAEKSVELEAIEEVIAEYPIAVQRIETATGTEKLTRTSATPHDNPVPTPPFWGSRVVHDIKIEKVWEYLNEVALFRGQWQMKRGKKSPEEFEKQIVEVARPKLQEVKLRAKRDRVLVPKVAYGYFPCWAEGEDLVILRSKNQSDLYVPWDSFVLSELEEWQRFTFPRQPTARRLCLSDFFLPKEEAERRNQPDVVAFTAVTVGREASRYTKQLFESNQYADYLYLHGLSVETAEALAEYWHKIVRTELGIADKDAPEITRLFSQGYQGSRYSFGYAACPNLEDQTKLFELIRPDRIDVTLTEEYHLEPEQSTTAIIAHHPSAKYFSIK